jgi:hypothetical protein
VAERGIGGFSAQPASTIATSTRASLKGQLLELALTVILMKQRRKDLLNQ